MNLSVKHLHDCVYFVSVDYISSWRGTTETFATFGNIFSKLCLSLEEGSDRRQTLPKRVSDDSRHFIFRRRKLFQNFERPFTPRGWLRSASNFGKTRFRWSPTFDFSTPKTFLRPKFLSDKIFRQHSENVFQQSACFGGAVLVWTSLADAPRKFIARHIGFNPLRPLAEG